MACMHKIKVNGSCKLRILREAVKNKTFVSKDRFCSEAHRYQVSPVFQPPQNK